jgi:hypothetical protein
MQRFNFFPAEVEIGEQTFTAARVIADDVGLVHVFVTGEDGAPALVASARVVGELFGGGPVPRQIATETGVWPMRLSRNCHCRDPLKRTSPERLLALV